MVLKGAPNREDLQVNSMLSWLIFSRHVVDIIIDNSLKRYLLQILFIIKRA